MTTLFDRPGIRPATHAFVVGVGSYRYLRDPQRPKVRALRLSPLTSPPVSARVFTDWLVGEHQNDHAPLASVELLLSAPDRRYRSPDGTIDVEVEPVTMANFKRAWDDWFARCDRHPGDIAIFFFCGHGTLKSNLALLMEDFGENEYRMFENAVNFDGSHQAMTTACQARVQCFFADACRGVPYAVLEREGAEGQILIDHMLRQYQAEDAPRFYATPPTNPAYGQSDEATPYTQALLQALRGAASWPSKGRWVVLSGRLQDGIRETMKRLQRDPQLPDQRPVVGGNCSGGSVIHVLPGLPRVPVSLEFQPSMAAATAEPFFVSATDPAAPQKLRFTHGAWEAELIAGDYDGGARFPKGDYSDYPHCRVTPYPPLHELLWEVQASSG